MEVYKHETIEIQTNFQCLLTEVTSGSSLCDLDKGEGPVYSSGSGENSIWLGRM